MKTKKIKSKAKPRTVMNFKTSDKEKFIIKTLAKRHAGGNVSKFLRMAVLAYKK